MSRPKGSKNKPKIKPPPGPAPVDILDLGTPAVVVPPDVPNVPDVPPDETEKGRKGDEAEKGSIPPAHFLPSPLSPQPPCAIRSYRPIDEDGAWRCEFFDLLTAEIGVIPDMAEFHHFVKKTPRAWTILRRLFGIMPMKMPLDGNPDDYRPWTRSELCLALGIADRELRAELEFTRAQWLWYKKAPDEAEKGRKGEGEKGSIPLSPLPPFPPAGPTPVAAPDNKSTLLAVGIAPAIFDLPHRTAQENDLERDWFCARLRDWNKLLESPMTKRLALQALLNELRLKRDEATIWELDRLPLPENAADRASAIRTRENEKNKLSERITSLEQTYQGQLADIAERAPWFNVTGAQVSIKGAFSEIIEAVREYESNRSTRLVDGVFTALELQVMLRTHLLRPEPQHRAGWVIYINAARAFLWDPNFRSSFKQSDLAKMDYAWKESIVRFNEQTGVVLPDLERDGPQNEYDELYAPAENAE